MHTISGNIVTYLSFRAFSAGLQTDVGFGAYKITCGSTAVIGRERTAVRIGWGQSILQTSHTAAIVICFACQTIGAQNRSGIDFFLWFFKFGFKVFVYVAIGTIIIRVADIGC